MSHEITVLVGPLAGIVVGIGGTLAVNWQQSKYAARKWLLDKQSELYESFVKEILRIGDQRMRSPADAIDMSNLRAFAYLFIRAYFASSVPYKQRPQFYGKLNEYKLALDKNSNIEDAQGELVNYLSDLARSSLGLQDAKFSL